MGYRNYIGEISRTEYEKIKNFSIKELFEYKGKSQEDDHVGVYDIAEEVYEFGKCVEFGDEKYYSPVFLKKETRQYYEEEYDFHIVGKEFLKHIIEHYTKKIQDFYRDLIKDIEDENNIDPQKALKLYQHVKWNSIEWLGLLPYDLEKGEGVTSSWKYEYSIFELVRIYKTFDWENKILIYYGY